VDRSISVIQLLPLLLKGFGITLLLAAVAIGLGAVFGTLLGSLYAWGGRVVRAVLFMLVTIVRGVPLVVQVFAVFFMLPAYGIKFSAVSSAGIALTLFASFTIMEIVRGASRSFRRRRCKRRSRWVSPITRQCARSCYRRPCAR